MFSAVNQDALITLERDESWLTIWQLATNSNKLFLCVSFGRYPCSRGAHTWMSCGCVAFPLTTYC